MHFVYNQTLWAIDRRKRQSVKLPTLSENEETKFELTKIFRQRLTIAGEKIDPNTPENEVGRNLKFN